MNSRTGLGVFLSVALPAAAVFVAFGLGHSTGAPFRMTVASGSSVRQIARQYHSEQLIRHPWLFVILNKAIGWLGAPQAGVYQVSPTQSPWTLWRMLQKGPPPVRVTLPEGWTAEQIAARLDLEGITPQAAFLDEVRRRRLEGMLFPDTYVFPQAMAADQVASRMEARFQEQKPPDWDDRARALRLTPLELLTLASIIEREARVDAERPQIAGIFLNRLRKRWLLESCATVQHAIGLKAGLPGQWKPRLLYKDLEIDSPYNTYRHRGLPPGPIGNPGKASLEAAAHPAMTEMMFFVADGEGTHRFSRYYREHLGAKKNSKPKTVKGKQ